MKKYKVVNKTRFYIFCGICLAIFYGLLAWVSTIGCQYAFEQVMKL